MTACLPPVRLALPAIAIVAGAVFGTAAAETLAVLPEGVAASYVLRLRDLPPAVQERREELLFDVNEAGRPFVLVDDLFVPLPARGDRQRLKPFRIDSPGRVRSMAIMRDGAVLAIAGRTLAVFEGDGFRPLTSLPARGMRVAPAARSHAYLYGGDTPETRRNLYLYRKDRKLILLVRSEEPLTAVAGFGDVTFFAAGKWIFMTRPGEPVTPLFRAEEDVTALAPSPPTGLFFATSRGVWYLFESSRAYRVFRGRALPVVRAGKLYVYFADEGDLAVFAPMNSFDATAAKLMRVEKTPDRAPETQIPAAGEEAFQRGAKAAAVGAWQNAIPWFSFAQRLAPSIPSLLFNLGHVHERAGHDLAAMAWYRAYLAAWPGAPDSAEVSRRLERLRARIEGNVVLIAGQGQKIHDELREKGIRPGTIKEYVQLSIRTAVQQGQMEKAETMITGVRDVTDRDEVWTDVAMHLSEWRDDEISARDAASRIKADQKRVELIAKLRERGRRYADEAVRIDGSAALRDWIDLARFLSAHGTSRLDGELRRAASLPVKRVSIGLLQVATDYASDYLRIRRVEQRYGDSTEEDQGSGGGFR